MSYQVGVNYLVLTVADYEFLSEVLSGSYDLSTDFSAYTDPTSGISYYIALESDVSASEMALISAEFDPTLFGTAIFTNSVQANIVMP